MGSPVPVTLTRWDFGFLRGLYSSRRDLRTDAQRSEIGQTVAKELQATVPK